MFQKIKIITIVQIVMITACTVFAQTAHVPSKERGESALRAKAQMIGNRIRTTILNHGVTGRTGGAPIDQMTPYEWPKNSGKVYLAHTGLFIGAETMENETPEPARDKRKIQMFAAPHWRTAPDGRTWAFHPVPGYASRKTADNVIATDVDETTWPDFWPDKMNDVTDPGWAGKWNGYFGKNIRNADQEIFYKASDDNYDKYTYFSPDSTDKTRKGLAMIMETRAMAWSQALVEDVVYVIHKITNDGTVDYDKTGFSIWYADFVGGDNDSMDDFSDYLLIEAIAWSYDKDNKAPTFGSDPVGIVGCAFLETPGNSTDRIDNDGDGEENSPKVTSAMLLGEDPANGIDDNGNGLVDESQAHIPFGLQVGVGYADGIDNNANAEAGSPLVTLDMVNTSATDIWKRWPVNPDKDKIQNGKVHLIMVENDDIGKAFKDNIDNNGNGEKDSPVITQAMITEAATDAPYYRYLYKAKNKEGKEISTILYNVTASSLGKKHADGIDNDNNGAIDENIDENIDEMIDESRGNGIDDDGDWDPLKDDVGLDGIAGTGDIGENDGIPTSGAGTGFPGEPNVDVTDVSESDMIGITSAQYVAMGQSRTEDSWLWDNLMKPGSFFDATNVKFGEYDLYINSLFFPMKSGQSERFSMAIILANAAQTDPGAQLRKAEILRKKKIAQETYENDYQFASAPNIPNLIAVPGDNKVTLYWDDIAEKSYDRYLANIGADGYDFEGYKIYRSQDPSFEDVTTITNAYGSKQFRTAIKIFDLEDGIKGLHPVAVNGTHFYMGEDSGLLHSFVDSTAKNGFTYYYAITSFDKGYETGEIAPSECPIRITLKGDGSVELGQNVKRVTPESPAAGFVPANLGKIEMVEGASTATIGYTVVDPDSILNGHVYHITFEDTIKVAVKLGDQDTLTTKNYTLTDSTANKVLIEKYPYVDNTHEQPLINGFRLFFNNEVSVTPDLENTKWNDPNIVTFVFEKFKASGLLGETRPNDYQIILTDPGQGGTSTQFKLGATTFPSMVTNFKVYNITTKKFIDFAFLETEKEAGEGILSVKGTRRDRVIFLEPNTEGNNNPTWWFYLNADPVVDSVDPGNSTRIPTAGDTLTISVTKPFMKTDKFRFTAQTGKINNEYAKSDLDKIRVVPNPYKAMAKWEKKNPYNSGRADRELHFINLPSECTIRIFTINGELVNTIEHKTNGASGTAYWNMLSKDNLAIAYGVYYYHVEAPGIGEKTGKFAVIK